MTYSNVIGFLHIEGKSSDNIIIDMTEEFENSFQPIYNSQIPIEDMAVSDDYRYIAVKRGYNVDVMVSLAYSLNFNFLFLIMIKGCIYFMLYSIQPISIFSVIFLMEEGAKSLLISLEYGAN